MAAPGIMPVIVQEKWVQCENPNCNKWRKVPAEYEVKEDEAWYCYLNPDDRKATCSASEEEYKEAIEITAPADPEEDEHNRLIRERLAASLLASTSGASGGKGKGRGKGRGGRGRGQQSKAGRGGGAAVDYFAGRRPKAGGPKYREDSDDDLDLLLEEEEEEEKPVPASAGRPTQQLQLQQQQQQPAYARHFLRLLEHQGSWEASQGHTTAGGAARCVPGPAEAWEGLGQHAPELAELACSAADIASSLAYFEGTTASGAPSSDAADAVARLAAMLASAAALAATENTLTAEERRSCCLDAAAAPAAAVPLMQVPAAAPAALQAFSMPAAFQQQQQPAGGVALPGAWPQQAVPLPGMPAGAGAAAAMFVPQVGVQQQPAGALQQQAMQLGAGAPQLGMPPGMVWPAAVPNGNHVQQQQPNMQQFAQVPQQWQQSAGGALPYGMLAPQQQPQQQPGSMPLMPGVSPDMVACYTATLQKPAGGQQANGGMR